MKIIDDTGKKGKKKTCNWPYLDILGSCPTATISFFMKRAGWTWLALAGKAAAKTNATNKTPRRASLLPHVLFTFVVFFCLHFMTVTFQRYSRITSDASQARFMRQISSFAHILPSAITVISDWAVLSFPQNGLKLTCIQDKCFIFFPFFVARRGGSECFFLIIVHRELLSVLVGDTFSTGSSFLHFLSLFLHNRVSSKENRLSIAPQCHYAPRVSREANGYAIASLLPNSLVKPNRLLPAHKPSPRSRRLPN